MVSGMEQTGCELPISAWICSETHRNYLQRSTGQLSGELWASFRRLRGLLSVSVLVLGPALILEQACAPLEDRG